MNKIHRVGTLTEMNGNDICKRVYGIDGVSPTLPTGKSGNTIPKILVGRVEMNKIITHNIQQMVRVRKHNVDIDSLRSVLRSHKNLSNGEIAIKLDKPETLVAHWFRNDDCFSIPDEDIWYELKKLLNIETNEFDISVTEFEEREGVYEKSNRVYDIYGVAPTITKASADEKILVDRLYEGCKVKNIENNRRIEMKELRLFEAFAGIGAVSASLERAGVPFKLVGYSEVDKYASKSFAAVHGVSEDLNLWDITKIDEKDKRLKNLDLFTYGFPCQDISLAGKQKGMTLDTRSGLLYDALRIIQTNMPKVCIAENVKNLVSKKFKEGFDSLLTELDFYGYNNYWKVLNGLDYGVPQQRERVFIVSIRKDVDNGTFEFGEKLERNVKLADVLEPIVDEKYYLSDKMVSCLIRHKETQAAKGNSFGFNPITTDSEFTRCIKANYAKMQGDSDYIVEGGQYNQNDGFQPNDKVCTIDASVYKGLGCNQNRNAAILRSVRTEYGKEIRKQYEAGEIEESRHNMTELQPRTDGVSNTITTVQKDNLVLEVREATKKGYAEATVGDAIDFSQPNSETRRGRVGKGYASTVMTSCNTATLTEDERIRRLTPRECWRLMDFTDEQFDRARDAGQSDSQLYKRAGNSIIVNVLVKGIFQQLYK